MSVAVPQIKGRASTVKRALDRLELVDRVPELRREAARVEDRLTEDGQWILIMPRHLAVIAYVNEQASVVRENCDLKTARRRLKDARVNYADRVGYRISYDIRFSNEAEGNAFVSLSAIIEARAEAVHWRKVVKEKERAARINKWNARQCERARPEFVTIGGELYPVSK